ncbi:TetR family transcriptional regulator [Malikia granosa]|uniref:TetR family transcriptional regulator n=1 Tax=Malikia granosa TaxID=263067 RepID=A0A2S9K4X7_9BURK|nr:TetR family transcriptional regulator [Malikia granosa]PRD65501.1 TetR family transcriptional regulator [Malikia granosa]
MARRTKADALATRHQLLDAAECLFAEKGVSRTSLNDIALAAGASRGAIYWHFKNKADLFNAMMERTTLPMEQALQQVGHEPGQDPLVELRRSIADAMHRIAHDERTRRVFEVATLKVEYVDELMAVRARHRRVQADNVGQMERSLQAALAQRALSLPLPVALLAQGLYALLVGLIHTWLLAPETFELEATAEASVQAYLAGWGLLPAQAG